MSRFKASKFSKEEPIRLFETVWTKRRNMFPNASIKNRFQQKIPFVRMTLFEINLKIRSFVRKLF